MAYRSSEPRSSSSFAETMRTIVGKAIDSYEQALVLHREIGDRRGEGSDLGNLGNACADLGEVKRRSGGEPDRPFELLGSASEWLQGRGRVREGP